MRKLFSCQAGDTDRAKRLFERDLDAGRLAPYSYLQYSELFGHKESYLTGLRLLTGDCTEDEWLLERGNAFSGRRCFIIGTGPSMNRIDCSRLKGETTFCTNASFYIENLPITYFVSVSGIFWRHHSEAIKQIECEHRFLPSQFRYALECKIPTSWLNAPFPCFWDTAGQPVPVPHFFSTDPARIVGMGGSVISVCLQLALYLGFSTIYLLGVDHDYGKEEKIFSHGGTLAKASDHSTSHFMSNYYASGRFHIEIPSMERAYRMARDVFEQRGRTIYNATPGTHLDTYAKVDFNEITS